MNRSRTSNDHGSWDAYWVGAGTGAAYSRDGAEHPEFSAFWNAVFADASSRDGGLSLLDIATGNGAVVERALTCRPDDVTAVTCVDKSEVAIDTVRGRFPQIAGIVADARAVPLDDARFDLVTSQFGTEYAGTAAMREAARLVAPGGTIAMLLHIEPGSIFEACSDSARAVSSLQQSRFVPLARHFFEAGFAAVRGADRSAYDAAGRKLAPAIAAVESILSDYGSAVAGGMISRLHGDVARIHERIQYHDPDEVLTWISAMESELAPYAERMAAMTRAALDERAFDRIRDPLHRAGFDILRAEALRPAGDDLPLAWAMIARRPA